MHPTGFILLSSSEGIAMVAAKITKREKARAVMICTRLADNCLCSCYEVAGELFKSVEVPSGCEEQMHNFYYCKKATLIAGSPKSLRLQFNICAARSAIILFFTANLLTATIIRSRVSFLNGFPVNYGRMYLQVSSLKMTPRL